MIKNEQLQIRGELAKNVIVPFPLLQKIDIMLQMLIMNDIYGEEELAIIEEFSEMVQQKLEGKINRLVYQKNK